MAKHEIETRWMGKMRFDANVNGHTIVMDAPARVGGEDQGPIPKPFVLTALSGCTGMDIVALLRKSGHELSYFNLKITGELTKYQPMQYVSIHLVYEFRGDSSVKEAALNAVADSQEKYCGVSNMLKKIMPVSWEVWFNEEQVFNNQHPETKIFA